MSTPNLFLDSSALIAGVASRKGAARELLVLSEAGKITLTISEQVIVETERNVARKLPRALEFCRQTIHHSGLIIVRDPSAEQIAAHADIIADPNDVPIVLAAMNAHVDYLVTHNRKHFLDDPKVAEKSGLRMGTPGDALRWLRETLA